MVSGAVPDCSEMTRVEKPHLCERRADGPLRATLNRKIDELIAGLGFENSGSEDVLSAGAGPDDIQMCRQTVCR